MQIKILRYSACVRSDVQAFIDLEVNGWLRFNGIHFQRDGTLRSAQLTPMRNGRRVFLPAVEVLDADLRELLTADILAAIHKHLETLPPEKRLKPPRPPEPRKPDEQRTAAVANAKPSPGKAIAKLQNAPVQAKPAPATLPAAPIKPKPVQTVSAKPAAGNSSLPPPPRLLATARGRSDRW